MQLFFFFNIILQLLMSLLSNAAIFNERVQVKWVILKYPGPAPHMALMSGAVWIYTWDQSVSFSSSLSL